MHLLSTSRLSRDRLAKIIGDALRSGKISRPKVKEDVELEENAKTFKSLEDWVMAVVNAGGTISKRANNLVASGLGRNQSATFELKKGRGSMLESNETE